MDIKQFAFLKHCMRSRRHVYLDHNATTNVSSLVRRRMNMVLKHDYGNPSALYGIARKSAEIMEKSRLQLAEAIHAAPEEIYFTGCATESNNAVLKSVSHHFYPKKNKIISTPVEHPSVINTLDFLKTTGIVVEYCPVDKQGRVSPSELEKLIDEDTFLICCMLANNEIGTIQDVRAITKIAHKKGVLVLSDCVQALGKIPVDVSELGIDYASFSAHKLYGPKGVGALYVKRGSPFAPFIHGGHQESGMRAGTEGLHNVAGFGAACQDVPKYLAKAEKIRILKRQLISQISDIKTDCVINSPDEDCLPNTASITFPNIHSAGLMAMLDFYGIAVSGGSACSAQEEKPSHVLKSIGLSDQAAQETIRISLGCDTSERDIRYFSKVLRDYSDGRTLQVNMITPAQLNETILNDRQTFILDVRPQIQRKYLKSLTNSYEASFFQIEKYLNQLPPDKNILVVCQHGNLSILTAYYLKSKGFEQVSNLVSGLTRFKMGQSDLYQKFAGQNITVLKPAN
jgi:cysteine desulfurase